MSHFSYMEKLLDGAEVEWKVLEDVVFFANGKGHEKVITENGSYIVVNSKFISTDGKVSKYSDEQLCPLSVDDILIVMSDLPNGKALAKTFIVDENDKYTLNQRIGAISVKNKKSLLPKFLNYVLNRTPSLTKYDNGVDQTNLKKGQILDVKIPIPCPNNPEKSLAIQAEIVRILDAFTAMTAELTAELNMRKKQYKYYRDQLLSFEDDEVEWKTLEEVAHFANGKGHEKDISENGKFIVVNSKFISTDGLVAKYSDSQLCPLFKDDILLVMSDLPNGKALSKTFIVDEDERYTLNQRIGAITVKDKSEMWPKFLHYYLDRTPQLLKHDNGVDQTNLRKGQILEVKVPILPLQKQEHIVSILDKFDKLTKSLSEGLPHEIELRQKQYEYYRELLLSFPKSEEVTA